MAKSPYNEIPHKMTLNVPPRELVRWVKEEIEEEHIHLNFYESAWKEYYFEKDYDYDAFGVSKKENLHLVTVEAILDIEPQVEQNYWILQLKVHDQIGLRRSEEEFPYISRPLSIDDFVEEFLKRNQAQMEIILFTETDEAKKHFDEWFSILKAEHRRVTTH